VYSLQQRGHWNAERIQKTVLAIPRVKARIPLQLITERSKTRRAPDMMSTSLRSISFLTNMFTEEYFHFRKERNEEIAPG
jgi:hypothetical protein